MNRCKVIVGFLRIFLVCLMLSITLGAVVSTAHAATLLPAPTLISPSNGATGVSTTPTFSWSSVSGANYYWLTVATNPSYLPTDPNAASAPNCVIGSNGVGIAATSYTPSSGVLSPGTTYYWKVQTYHGSDALHPDQQGNYSSQWQFTTAPSVTLLPAPTITSPGSSSSPGPTISTLTPTLQWSGVSGADYYGLYIRDLATNSLVFDSQARGLQLTGSSYTLPSGVLEWGKPYRWNMNSHNSAGWGSYSSVLYFQTQPPPAVNYTLTVNLQGQGTVSLSPSGGSYASGTQVALTATPASGWQFSGWSGDLTGSQNPATITMNSNKSVTAYFAQQAPPASIPTVETRAATAISQSGAIINGAVVTEGGSGIVERRFDWGTTPDCSGGVTASVSVSGSYFSYYLGGLNPGTTYYFRAWAKNSAGWGQGSVLYFTTSQNQQPTLSFTNLTPSTITTSQSTYDATLSATGTNFNNVNQITFSWSGPDSGSATWNKGGSSWNVGVTVNSDTSMTLRPRVLYNASGSQSQTWAWTVTLKDTTGATASRSFTATYNPPSPTQYTLTISVNGQGSTNPSPGSYNHNQDTQVAISASPTSGWRFDHWGGDVSGTNASITITMNSNKSVVAYFQQEIVSSGSISVSSNPSGASFSLSGPTSYSGVTPWSTNNAPVGSYTITWGPMTGYTTPSSETKTLAQGASIIFSGLYTERTLIAGKDVPQRVPDFFGNVLNQLNIPYSNFAVEAFNKWTRYEDTNAYWNPLATTRGMGVKSWDFNNAGVKNYVDEETGVQATADTLNLSYYDTIRKMLRQESFDKEQIRQALNTWSYNSGYVSSLLNEWEALWNASLTTRDTTPPRVTISGPPSGQTFASPTIIVTGIASDDVAVSKVEVRIGSGSWQTASGTNSWSIQVTLNSGSNIVYVRAIDMSGNISEETSVAVNIRSTSSVSYNREAAVGYAGKYRYEACDCGKWYGPSQKEAEDDSGLKWLIPPALQSDDTRIGTKADSDCAHFVSHCLAAGGLDNANSVYARGWCEGGARDYIITVTEMREWFIDTGVATKVESLGVLEPGDVIIMNNGSHIVLYIGGNQYASHSAYGIFTYEYKSTDEYWHINSGAPQGGIQPELPSPENIPPKEVPKPIIQQILDTIRRFFGFK